MNGKLGLILLGLFLVVMFDACSQNSGPAEAAFPAAKSKVELSVYGTGLCEQTAATIRESVAAVRALGPDIGLKVCLVGLAVGKGERKSFASAKGPAEIDADKIVVCARSATGGDRAATLDVLECLFSAPSGPTAGLDSCAAKLKLDAPAIRTCAGSSQGSELLAADFEFAKQQKIITTPLVTVDGRPYVGVRTSLELQRTACSVLAVEQRPALCATLPEPKKLTVYAITDKRCAKCDVEISLQQLMNTVPGIEPKRLDWSADEAKAVLEKAGMPKLPALVFSEDLAKHPEVTAQLGLWIETNFALSSLRVPEANFDPRGEICDNGIDDTGEGKVDCADPTCVANAACRPEVRKRLDVFMLGGCPIAGSSMESVDKLHEEMSDLRMGIHFIAFRKENKVVGMRSPNELAEAQIELCAMKLAKKDAQGLEFSFCRADSSFKPGFEDCAEKSQIDLEALGKCAMGEEGAAALAADMELAEKLGIRRSPTYLINNRFIYEGTQKDLRAVYCAHNASTEACKGPAPAHQGHSH
ncbi:MAG: hypothetical protein MUC50_05085 [Myxococcota bacterium]|nr:hypothetical protein [Myxococcota bacterium]